MAHGVSEATNTGVLADVRRSGDSGVTAMLLAAVGCAAGNSAACITTGVATSSVPFGGLLALTGVTWLAAIQMEGPTSSQEQSGSQRVTCITVPAGKLPTMANSKPGPFRTDSS